MKCDIEFQKGKKGGKRGTWEWPVVMLRNFWCPTGECCTVDYNVLDSVLFFSFLFVIFFSLVEMGK